MRLGYTEFSFGYAFTENLLRSASTALLGAPVFPNLVQEGRLGYDVRIDLPACPLFFQYKLPDLMVRDTAFEISKRFLDRDGLATPFFRMHLMQRDLSRQHERLIDLEGRYPHSVYYATPTFKFTTSFNAAYNTACVHSESVLFSPTSIGNLPDDKPHTIAYRHDLEYAWFCSEPRKIPAFKFKDVVDQFRTLFEEQHYQLLQDMAGPTFESILGSIPLQLRGSENDIRQRIRARRMEIEGGPELDEESTEVVEDLLVSRELSRVGLGLEFLIAQPRLD